MKKIAYKFGDKLHNESRLSYLFDDVSKNYSDRKAFFLCECGEVKSLYISLVKRGNTKSCGCYHKDVVGTHGLGGTRVYKIWKSVLYRSAGDADHYKDVTVCDRWSCENGLKNFIEDMGYPESHESIDRIDGRLGYFPENCRWATQSQQKFNRKLLRNNTSGRTGVFFVKKWNKWCASLSQGGEYKLHETFDSFEEAVRAREEAEMKFYGRVLDYDYKV